MIRVLFCLTLITLLVVYVPDSTRKELKNIITSVYGGVHKFVEKTFPDSSNKLKDLLSQATDMNVQQIDFNPEQRQLNEHSERADKNEERMEATNEQSPSINTKQFQAFYKKNRNKLVELMNILGKSNNDKDG